MSKSYLKRFTVSIWCLAISAGGGGAAGGLAVPSALAAQLDEGCADCHQKMADTFAGTFHARIWEGMGQQHGCQTCHGDTAEHTADPTMQNVLTYRARQGSPAEQLSAKCLECHSGDTHLAMWDLGQHSRNDVSCFSCHVMHAPRAEVDQPATCFTCHRSSRMEVSKQSHHPIMENKIKCSDCHNTHGALSRAMIRDDSVNQLCYQCHAEKRGPYVWEHPPVEENCLICHTPHGSRHAKLLVEKVPNICQDCHDWSGHPGAPYDATGGFTGSVPNDRFFARSCLNCHGAIHGSAHFEHHGLTR
ncbi:MAG: DmsE family decaheme c-type cytochrome [Desulfurivibrio sp.]|nr:MAG: DmsE family decaheme c-type cytochrome [Desulfurivibrio sp.]